MAGVERELSGFQASPTLKAGATIDSFTLETSSDAVFKGFTYTLTFPLENTFRVLLTGPDRPQPPHDNIVLKAALQSFTISAFDSKKCKAVIPFPKPSSVNAHLDGSSKSREIRLNWSDSILLEVWESENGEPKRLCGDLPARSYALTQHGIMRHWWIERENLHLGMGEKAGPIDLTGRNFRITGSDAACYDTYESDPLYKHTPFLISTPKPVLGEELPSTYAIYHASNSAGTWDIGRHHDDPWGYFKTFTQDWGGLEEWIMVGKGVKEVVRTWAELVGMPRLVGRDWLGYLASGMGLGESDSPPAQELLAEWPELCKKYGIPCSAIHFSSGYTVGKDGKRYVFTLNTKRYPDFKGLISGLHKAGIKVVPNIKPYLLDTHPSFKGLHAANALFENPFTKSPVVTRIWSSGIGENDKGSWVDMTSKEGRQWWANGVKELIAAGMDGMWNDNDEYYLHDDEFICKNDLPVKAASPARGTQTVGMMGRMINTELLGKVSHDELVAANPDRRVYVLTRSANVGTFKYVPSTWTGDNETSWKNLRGSQPIQLNAGMSLMQSTGSDIGGFGGPLPDPELFTRWVQLGVTHARFCIHSFKPSKEDSSGVALTNLPWMYPEVLPIIRNAIKWRYEYLPFFNSLMWESHLQAAPTNAWLGWGEFATDPELYTESSLNGFDAWIGAGQLLSAPALFEGELSRTVYFPKTSIEDKSLYFDLHAPYGRYAAGTRTTIATPLDHMGLFAREGAVIPIGKPYHTVTQRTGLARTTPDGVDVQLEEEGGVVGLDDWRGVQIFPSTANGKKYTGHWTEDDGISARPEKTVVEITYESEASEIKLSAKFKEHGFKALWGTMIHVLLPVGDGRSILGAKEVVGKDGRVAHIVEVA